MKVKAEETLPSASRLIAALSQIGYRLEDSIADLVDNSISAGASEVLIRFEHDEENIQRIMIVDNGHGMSRSRLREAMRFGSEKSDESISLGKFGLGMKLASLSYCDDLTVSTRKNRRGAARRWTVSNISSGWNCEVLTASSARSAISAAFADIDLKECGTAVIWQALKNLPTHKRGIRSVLGSIERRLRLHLGLRFHRFLESGALVIKMDQQVADRRIVPFWIEIEPLNPFAYEVSGSPQYPKVFVAGNGLTCGPLTLEAHIWPPNSESSNYRLGKRASAHQGFFVYRNNRLIQAGGWLGLVNDDTEPHSSLARVKLDLPEAAEDSFGLNVQKSSVIPPLGFQDSVREALSECGVTWDEFRSQAQAIYRGSRHVVYPTNYYIRKPKKHESKEGKGKEKALHLKWSRAKSAPLVQLRGDTLIFNPSLKPTDSQLYPEIVYQTLVELIVALINDPKNKLRSKTQTSFFTADLERALTALLQQ